MTISAADSPLVTKRLHAELWNRFGREKYPAEWDGRSYGGGTLSQRYWEYFKTIELLDLTSESVVLDIGGGSPETGVGFFASLIATAVKKVVVMDSNINEGSFGCGNLEVFGHLADEKTLAEAFTRWPEISHVSCVSVLEHVPPDVRRSIMKGINDGFQGQRLVLTLEYHAKRRFFEHQLTTRSLAETLNPLDRFYPCRMEASPVLAENAYVHTKMRVPGPPAMFKIWKRWFTRTQVDIPCWYPLAIAFESSR